MTAKRRRKLRLELFLSQNGSCALCQKDLPPLSLDRDQLENPNQYPTLDHIIPTSKGGTNRVSNLQLVHNKCNNDKGDRIVEDTMGEET